MRNKLLIASLFCLFFIGKKTATAQKTNYKYSYNITLSNGNNQSSQKESITFLRGFFNSPSCTYNKSKNIFIVKSQHLYDLVELKAKIEKQGVIINGNIKSNTL